MRTDPEEIGPGPADEAAVAAFIARWSPSAGAETANFQSFVKELCALLDLPQPDVSGPASRDYVFERKTRRVEDSSSRSVDLWRRDAFVMEAKQGGAPGRGDGEGLFDAPTKPARGTAPRGTPGWAKAMLKARNQARNYAQDLHDEGEAWPPFLVVVDVGYSFDLYAEFTRSGASYTPFPDPSSHRFGLEDLGDPAIRTRLRALWLAPDSLNPAIRSAKVTREVAAALAELAKSYEREGRSPEQVAHFLLKLLFTMFAEDVGLLPRGAFTAMLCDLRGDPAAFPPMLEDLWRTMDSGGFYSGFRAKLLRFNGELFADSRALPVSPGQLDLIIAAAEKDWRDVEPAIFGTLLEQALDPKERARLGAHYTPRAYVERLVEPALMAPLREDWAGAQAAALKLLADGKAAKARETAHAFRRQLGQTRVLDPACGSGNFLYVALEHMKRLEGEVLAFLADSLGETTQGLGLSDDTVDPHNFLGIETNPRAAAVAEMVLWIGWLQWHFRTHGRSAQPPDPVLKRYHNIETRDAVLDYAEKVLRRDETGAPVTRWDGETYRLNPATGAKEPDPAARVEAYDYKNPKPAQWSKADFIIGNPPFIGGKDLRERLGEGYATALWAAHKLPESADFVMYWWAKAAAEVRLKRARRFGFITTNSLPQVFNSRVVKAAMARKPGLSLAFAIPDHPWADGKDVAAVRVAMTVGVRGRSDGALWRVTQAERTDTDTPHITYAKASGRIHANLRLGADLTAVKELQANDGLSSPGVKLHGAGFIVDRETAAALGLGTLPGVERHIREYRNGRDLAAHSRDKLVIDLFGLDEEALRRDFPTLHQHVAEHVKPERDERAGSTKDADEYAKKWWLFGKPRSELRPALAGLPRYIATVETAKHRWFTFLDAAILPDNMLVAIGLADAAHLALLSSRIHVVFALAAGGRLGYGNDPRYSKSRCFDPFPFPDPIPDALRERLRALGEELDAFRTARLAAHPELTMTKLYNGLEALRTGAALDEAGRAIHEAGLISTLKALHDAIDDAAFEAYGWPADLSDEAILDRLVALNAERAREEAAGQVRWLRPDYQNPDGTQAATQKALDIAAAEAVEVEAWPGDLAARMTAVRGALGQRGGAATAQEIAAGFKPRKTKDVADILGALAAIAAVRDLGDGRFAA